MKVNDIVNEGIFDDLRAMGKMRQQEVAKTAKQNAGSVFRDLKNALTPEWYKNMANRIANSRYNAEIDQMANEWAQQWEAVVDRLAAAKPKGQVITLDEYKRAFTKFLEQQTKTSPNQQQLNTSITEPDIEMVKNYLSKYYIPMYMAKEQVEADKEFARSYGIDVDDPADLDAAAKQADAGQKPTGTDSAEQPKQSAEPQGREFTYTDSQGDESTVKEQSGKYYIQDPESGEYEELTHPEDIAAVEKQDPEKATGTEEPDTDEDFEPDETFTYTDSQGDDSQIGTKDGKYYIQDPQSGEYEELTHPEDIAAVKEHDPALEGGDGEPADQEDVAKAVEAAKKDKGTDNNVPGSKQDFHVVTYTPDLVIRYKNQEFLMKDDDYPKRDWYKLPNGTPVKEVMVPMLNKMADEAFAEQDKAAAGGREETDIDAGPSESAGVRVEPGTKLRVTDPKINGVFYKDALGNWTTEEGRRLKKPETLKYLEKLVKDGAPTRTEKVLPPTPEEKKKGVSK